MHNSAPETRPEHIYNTSSYILYLSAKEIALPEQYFNRNGSKKTSWGIHGRQEVEYQKQEARFI